MNDIIHSRFSRILDIISSLYSSSIIEHTSLYQKFEAINSMLDFICQYSASHGGSLILCPSTKFETIGNNNLGRIPHVVIVEKISEIFLRSKMYYFKVQNSLEKYDRPVFIESNDEIDHNTASKNQESKDYSNFFRMIFKNQK